MAIRRRSDVQTTLPTTSSPPAVSDSTPPRAASAAKPVDPDVPVPEPDPMPAGVIAAGMIQASKSHEDIPRATAADACCYPAKLDEVEVTVGPETYTPIRFQSVTIGAITGRAQVQPGETIEDAIAKLRARLDAAFRAAFALVKAAGAAFCRQAASRRRRTVDHLVRRV